MLEYRPPSTKVLTPPPPEFAEQFIIGGWRKVERIYGARTDLLVKWRVMCGGEELDAARRHYRATGVIVVPVGCRSRLNLIEGNQS